MINEEATFERFGYYPSDLKPKSGKKIVAACDDCGKIRLLQKGLYRPLCSSCTQKGAKNPRWKGGLVMRICEFCGVEFPIDPSAIKQGRGKFCTRGCYSKWMSKRRKEDHPRWKGGDIKRICETCGIEFPVEPFVLKRGKGRFCSPACFGKWLSENRSGANSSHWKNGASFEPYCSKFNNEFKEYIREKFGRICFLCSKTEEENGRRLSVHHVNYNKDCGCDDDETCQFVPLCIGCNTKANSNREMWEKKIKDKMRNKLSGWYI